MDQTDRVRSLYETTLRPRIAALEGLRRDLRSTIAKAGLLVGVPLFGIIFGDQFDSFVPGYGDLIPWASFGLLLLALIVAFRLYFMPAFTASANYKTRFKHDVVSEIFKVVCPGATYLPFESIPEQVFDAPGIFHRGGYWSDDLVRGTIGETPFEAAEVRRSYTARSAKSSHSHVVFRGLFFHIDFNRTLRGTTIVDPTSAGGFQIGDRSKLAELPVDHAEFAEEFNVHTSDPPEAREVLTSGMMDRLLALRQRTGHPIFAAFANNRLYLGVHYNRELFEPGIMSTVSLDAVREMAAHFALAEAIVRELELNAAFRTKPADASFLERPAEREDKLAAELMTGTLTVDEAWEKVARLAGADPAEEAQAAARPVDTTIDVQHDASGTTIAYGLPFSFFVTLLISAASAVIALYAFAALDVSTRLGPLQAAIEKLPRSERLESLVHDAPLIWLIGATLVGSFLSLWWITRVRRVTITRDAIRIARGLRPFPRTYARPPYGRVVRLEKAVYIGKIGGTTLMNPSASPILRSEDEARWIAAELRRALR